MPLFSKIFGNNCPSSPPQSSITAKNAEFVVAAQFPGRTSPVVAKTEVE
jgi:hypothetical protein